MRPAKLHELCLPTQYEVWRRYVEGTDLQHRIGPAKFAELLNQRQAIELVQTKGYIKCKIKSETKIQAALTELYSRPYQSLFWASVSKLAKRINSALMSGTQGPTR